MAHDISEERQPLLHQMVHGYGDGHQLLASSTSLSKETSRLVTVLSDLSGSELYPGFEEYLTGYPLVEAGVFVFGKTWYAEEMRRPGCVWTHSFLINFADLRVFNDLRNLLPLFKRPTTAELENGSYSKPLACSLLDRPVEQRQRLFPDVRFTGSLIAITFSNFARPVVIPQANSKSLEAAILGIWSLLGPSLWQQRSFCTGALSIRTINKKLFDLQIVPDVPRQITRIRREHGSVIVVEPELKHDVPQWAFAVATEIENFSSDFKQFLFAADYGRQVIPEQLPILMSLFQELQSPGLENKLDDILQTVFHSFPDPSQAPNLKSYLFGPSETRLGALNVIPEGQFLAALAQSNYNKCLSSDQLDLASRCKNLWEMDRTFAKSLVVQLCRRYRRNVIEQSILHSLLSTTQVQTAIELTEGYPRLWDIILNENRKLTIEPEFWSVAPIAAAEEGLALLVEDRTVLSNVRDTKQLIKAILQRKLRRIGRTLLDYFGPIVIHAFLDWCNEADRESEASSVEEWFDVLTEHKSDIFGWLSANLFTRKSTLVVIARSFNLKTDDWTLDELKVWHDRKLSSVGNIEQSDAIYLDIFTFSVAIGRSDAMAFLLLLSVFESVHAATERSAVRYEAWRLLEDRIPTVPNSWDKCERLRRALLTRISQHDRDLTSKVSMFLSEHTLSELARTKNNPPPTYQEPEFID